ncbi:anoctamin-4-like isoform X2 [Porites lutea]|uniref:anoctamin-4-like isoform X2 n=1 Tax=Porites lutea TaxID=51062 RepID=UPI003CC54EDF
MDRGVYAKLSQDDDPVEPEARNQGAYPRDEGLRIDYVLVYETCKEEENEHEHKKKEAEKLENLRRSYEKGLEKKGLIIRQDSITVKKGPDVQRHFVLIHATWEFLSRRAEKMRLKIPLQPNDVEFPSLLESWCGPKRIEALKRCDPLRVHDATVREKGDYFVGRFQQEQLEKYINYEDKDIFFSTVDRMYMVQQILQNTRFSEEPHCVGLNRLVLDGAYTSHYPLHEGTAKLEEGEFPVNDRQRLKSDWARFGRCFKYQPYEAIKDYFGHEIGLYFAWLGFYTAMLVPLAIFSLIVFLYGILSLGSFIPVQDVCNERNEGVWYMCPLCDRECSYWSLATTTCLYASITYIFDNDGTPVLAFVASIWATLFLEFWKRRQASIAQAWHTKDFEAEDEPLRPEYVSSLTKEELDPFRPDPDTGKIVFRAKRMKQNRRFAVVASVVTFMICLVLAVVIGVVVFRAAVFATLSSSSERTVQSSAQILTTGIAACINLVAITVLKNAYNKIAVWLTNWENPKTRTIYEDNFTTKMALFQFVNTFSSIIYIAFFKSDLIVGTPGRYTRVFGEYRLEGCSEEGCFLELAIQIAILMIGLQIVSNILEVGIPWFKLWLKRKELQEISDQPQYIKDYNLSTLEDHYLFWDYLEIVLQYGFVTMFLAAFPLAPIFALINAVAEIRVDAINMVSYHRRPPVGRAEDIGAWYSVLEAVTIAAVLMNAFVLAFTSEFIPRLLYRLKYAPDRNSTGGGTLKGFVNNSLASIDLKTLYTWEPGTEPINPFANLNYTRDYCSMIAWIIPDVPEHLEFKNQRENQVVREKLGTASEDESEEEDGRSAKPIRASDVY